MSNVAAPDFYCSNFAGKQRRKADDRFNQFSLSEIRLWNDRLAQPRCYQPLSIFKDFHHQDFVLRALPGHAGVKLRKLRLGMRIHALSSFRPQICYLLNSWSKRMGCIQFNYHFHPVPPVWESTHFPKIQVY